MNFSDKLKELRKEKNVSQEKLAEYLGVSFQAVSKWENAVTSPDISVLPLIARYYGITVDELLQVEKLDEKAYIEDCCRQSQELFRNGQRGDILPIWQEAHRKLPNNMEVKEMLMSTLFDIDPVKYQNEIVELGTEICTAQKDALSSYLEGQAINQVARTYYAAGNKEKAREWARKAHQLNHSQEMLYMQINDEEEWLAEDFRFANHWYFDELFYMAMRLDTCNVYGRAHVQQVMQAVADVYETVFPGDDMSFEMLDHLCILHRGIAEDEMGLGGAENVVRKHLSRAVECAVRSASVTAHALSHPLVYGWKVEAAPTDHRQLVRRLLKVLKAPCFDACRERDWFVELAEKLENVK